MMKSFDINEYIKEHREVVGVLPEYYAFGQFHDSKEIYKPLPAIECTNGFIFSVQASEYTYCTPRDNNGPYTHVEVGFPSERVKELMPYIDGDSDYPTETVYGYVPVEIVEAIIDKRNNYERVPIWTAKMFGRRLGIYIWRRM